MRLLRFLWLLLRGVLWFIAYCAGVIGGVALFIWLTGDAGLFVLLGLIALFVLSGIAFWIASCWRDSRTGARP